MKNKIILTTATALISIVLFAQTPKAYITNYGSNFISIIDIHKNHKIADVITGSKPHGVAVSPDGNWNVVATIPVGKNPKRLWVAITK